MGDPVRATLTVPIGGAAAGDAFEVLQHGDDAAEEIPALYEPATLSSFAPYAAGPGVHSALDTLRAYGRAQVRVYCSAALVPELVSLGPPQAPQPAQGSYFVASTRYTAPPNGYTGATTQRVGRRAAEVFEALEWSGEREQRVRYGYDAPAVAIEYAGAFVDADGNPAPAPRHAGGGVFRADRPVTGALLVRYSPGYWAFRVWYDVPGRGVHWRVSEGTPRTVTWLEPPPDPPLLVYARAGARVATAQVERRVYQHQPPIAGNQEREGAEFFDGTTVAQTLYPEERLENPSDPSQFINVQDKATVLLQDLATGRLMRLRLPK